jgi:glycosyltransferase involved in cell wall biosynthesis
LGQTIESVLNQTYKDWELIIVNDGSSDETEQIVESYVRAGWPIIYRYQVNKGFASARNLCVELATGQYVALVDHDDLCFPHRLAQQIDAAARHPDVGLLFSDSQHFRDDGTIVRRQFQCFSIDPCSLDLSAKQAANQLLIHGCFIDTETVMFRREVAQEVGGFNTAFRYIVDYDFFLRVGEKYPMFADPHVLSKWRIHSHQASKTMREAIFSEHIDVFKQWLAKSTLSRDARRRLQLRLWKMLWLYSIFLISQRQFRAGRNRLFECFQSRPDAAEVLKFISGRLVQRIKKT